MNQRSAARGKYQLKTCASFRFCFGKRGLRSGAILACVLCFHDLVSLLSRDAYPIGIRSSFSNEGPAPSRRQ